MKTNTALDPPLLCRIAARTEKVTEETVGRNKNLDFGYGIGGATISSFAHFQRVSAASNSMAAGPFGGFIN